MASKVVILPLILLAVIASYSVYAQLVIKALKPVGIKITLFDWGDYRIVSFTANVNKPLPQSDFGEISKIMRFNHKNLWSCMEKKTRLNEGDVLNYKVSFLDNTGHFTIKKGSLTISGKSNIFI